jgi:hypothetical protein
LDRDRARSDNVMKRILVALGLGFVICLRIPSAPAFAEVTCGHAVTLGQAEAKCVQSAEQTHGYIVAHSDHTFAVTMACTTDNAVCPDTPTCRDGLVYNVFEDGAKLDWQACLTKRQADRINHLTPGMVQRALRRPTWPASELVAQPPNGRTLVNFETNFYTTNTSPTTRAVTLIGRQVTIEATPTSYTWHFGDDDGLTTTDAGAPYPDLRITYRYTHVGSVRPSVDTTYSGRFRVGNGGWQAIPDTLTVPGAAVDLEVVSATPHLVGY